MLAAVLLVGGVAVASEPAGAADGHRLVVTPDRNLVDGQTVTLHGSGYVEDTPDWAVTMCDTTLLTTIDLFTTIDHCDLTRLSELFAHADANGEFTLDFQVRKSFPLQNGTQVTCGQRPDDCAVLVAMMTAEGFVGAAAPVSFTSPPRTLRDCLDRFLADHERPLLRRLARLIVCAVQVKRRPVASGAS